MHEMLKLTSWKPTLTSTSSKLTLIITKAYCVLNAESCTSEIICMAFQFILKATLSRDKFKACRECEKY